MNLLSEFDLELLKKHNKIIGIDEVGRGCLAGPLIVCGIIMKYDNIIEEINDSKKLSIKKREELNKIIFDNIESYCIIEVSVEDVDKYNVYQATKKAMNEIADKLNEKNALILSDAMNLDFDNNLSLIKGDTKSYAIACASIVAKVYRDNLMDELDLKYPSYDLKNNKGYGTKKHLEAVEKYGYNLDIHRKTFDPVKSMLHKQMSLF